MTLQDTREHKVSHETTATDRSEDAGARPVASDSRLPWPKRLVEWIKQRERFQACAYFVSTIL